MSQSCWHRGLDDKDEVIRRIYLPVSSHRLLVGTPFSHPPHVSVDLVNKASARCSYEFFIASTPLSVQSSLVRGIGHWSGLLSQTELDQVAAELDTELGQSSDNIG